MTGVILWTVFRPSQQKYSMWENSHKKAVSPKVHLVPWTGMERRNGWHAFLIKTHKSLQLLTEDPTIGINCAKHKLLHYLSVQSNLFLLTTHHTGHYSTVLLIRVCQSEGKRRQKQDLKRRQIFAVMKITLLELEHWQQAAWIAARSSKWSRQLRISDANKTLKAGGTIYLLWSEEYLEA